MPVDAEAQRKKETLHSLNRMQEFDAQSLPREGKLGEELNFLPAVEPAERLARLYKQISPSIIEDLSNPLLDKLKNQADTDFSRLDEILKFSTSDQTNPSATRINLISRLTDAYQGAFQELHPIISYSTSKVADFKRLESEGRAAVQAIKDQTDAVMKEIRSARESALEALDAIRKTAAEQGVSQQASHFREEAKSHDSASNNWLRSIWFMGCAVLFWALLCMVIHKIPWIAPASPHEGLQLVLGKILVFGVLSFGLYLCVRNFLVHRHNAVVNKHRQNALMTYEALVEAASAGATSDIVLTRAAACIFAPQPTGYTGGRDIDGASAKSIVELIGKPIMDAS